MSSSSDPATARLSVQRALLGRLTPNLFGACVALEGEHVVLTWYVAADLANDEREDLQAAGAEVIADFPDPFQLDERFVDVDDRNAVLATAGSWVVLQRGFRTA